MKTMPYVCKGALGAMGALMVMMAGAPALAEDAKPKPNDTCWSGQMLIPSDQEYDTFKARVKVFEYKLRKDPENEEVKQALAKVQKIVDGYVKDVTPVQKMFATGGRLPIAVTRPVAFAQGQRVTIRFQTCDERGVEGFCSAEASEALKDKTLETVIEGVGTFPTKDGYAGFVQLYLTPTLEGKSGIAYARLQYLGPPFGAPDNTSLSGTACPK